MKLKLVNLVPLNEYGDYENDIQDLKDELAQLYRDQEETAEPEGGPIQNAIGAEIEAKQKEIEQAIGGSKQPKKDVPYDVAIGKMTQDEYDKHMLHVKYPKYYGPGGVKRFSTVKPDRASFEKSTKFDRMNEATEKAWNALDVSRKAEKEIDNKEWNSRTTAKLDMLKALNKAGKFKKDWDEEKLQGWVDQNYSWEKLARQFKLNEIKDNKMKSKLLTERLQELAGIKPLYTEMFPNRQNPRKPNLKSIADVDNSDWSVDGGGGSIGYLEWEDGTEMTPTEIQDYFETNHEMYDDIMQGLGETMQQGDYSAIEQGWDGLSFDEQRELINSAMSGEARPDEFEKDFDQLKSEIPDWESIVAGYLGIDEGSCGYSPEGKPGNTPGETRGMPADTRTMTMMREAIRKEIKKLSEKKGVKHYTKDGKEWKGATHKMPNGPLMTQDPHSKDSVELFHKEDLKETSLDDKLKGAFSDEEWEKITSKPVPGFDNINPGNTKDQDTKRKAYIKRFGDKSPGQR